jgi:hypothetical protein
MTVLMANGVKSTREGNFLNLRQRENTVVPDEDIRMRQSVRREMCLWPVAIKVRGETPSRALTQ